MDFEQTYLGDFAHLVSGDGGQSVWSVCPLFVMYYPDAVNSTETQIWDYPPMQKLWLPPLMADPTHAGVCWLGGDHLVRLQSTLGTITAEEQTYDFGGPIAALACAPLDTDYWYVRDREGRFFYSSDSGASWTRSEAYISTDAYMRSGTSIVASPTNLGTVWIAGSGYDVLPVWISHDHGETFTDFSTGLPSTLVYMMDVSDDGRWLFAATEVGPYIRDLEGGDWQYAGGVTAPDQVYWCVEWVEALQTARFGTYGRGIWDFTLGSGAPEEDVPLAAGFGLRAAPNPFNASTTISFDLPRDAQVAIDLYDVRGAHMVQVFEGPLTAGTRERTLRADRLPSGVYLVRLRVEGAQETLRVTLVE